MAVNAKHLATFILGAAAGVAMHKYLQTEDGEKLAEDLKTKANQLKTEAEEVIEKAPEYFEQLKGEAGTKMNEVMAMLKEKYPDLEKMLQDLMGGKISNENTPST